MDKINRSINIVIVLLLAIILLSKLNNIREYDWDAVYIIIVSTIILIFAIILKIELRKLNDNAEYIPNTLIRASLGHTFIILASFLSIYIFFYKGLYGIYHSFVGKFDLIDCFAGIVASVIGFIFLRHLAIIQEVVKIVENKSSLNKLKDITYSYVKELKQNDSEFIKQLLNSRWYINNNKISPNQIDISSLISQPFFKEHIGKIVDLLWITNKNDLLIGNYSKEYLLKMFAIGTIHSLPLPIIKTAEGIISVGSQLLINFVANIKLVNKFHTRSGIQFPNITDQQNYTQQAARNLLQKSLEEFGPFNNDEINELKNN